MTRLIPYDRKYLPDFVALNRQWIEHYFRIEPMDLHQLEHAEPLILREGGEIFFVLEGERAVGTCAMLPHGVDEYELIKMAVDPAARGKGYGELLMRASIDWARAKRAKKIIILSNTILAPAIALYRKHGFVTLRENEPHPDYERCNIEMELSLS